MIVLSLLSWFREHKRNNSKKNIIAVVEEMRESFENESNGVQNFLPSDDLLNDKYAKECGKALGKRIADKEIGVRYFKSNLSSYLEYIKRQSQQQQQYIQNIEKAEKLIDEQIKEIEDKEKGHLVQLSKRLEQIKVELKAAKEKLVEDQHRELAKNIKEVEKEFNEKLKAIEDQQFSPNRLAGLNFIEKYYEKKRQLILLKIDQTIERISNEREYENILEESDISITTQKTEAAQKTTNLDTDPHHQLEEMNREEERLLKIEADKIDARDLNFQKIKEGIEESYRTKLDRLKNLLYEKKKMGILVLSRFNLAFTLFALMMILVGEVALVSTTTRDLMGLNLDISEVIIHSWNLIFVLSYTLAFSLAIKYYLVSRSKMAAYSPLNRDKKNTFFFRRRGKNTEAPKETQPKNIDNSTSEINHREFIQVRSKARFSLFLCILALISVIAIEPANMFKLLNSAIPSEITANDTENIPEGFGFLNWLYTGFNFYGVILFLICITILYGGVGALLYRDFFSMYEKFKNSGRSFWRFWQAPETIRVLIKEKKETEEEIWKYKAEVERLKSTKLKISNIRSLYEKPVDNAKGIEKMAHYRIEGLVSSLAMGYEEGKEELRQETGNDQMQGYFERVEIMEAIAKNVKKIKDWETIFKSFFSKSRANSNGLGTIKSRNRKTKK